jgi:2-hydroxychromene-2-carboxylate isomerase
MQTEHPEQNTAFAQRMFRKIYDGTSSLTWPDEMDDVLDELGLDGKAIVKKAKKNEDKYIAIVDKNQEWCHASGHGGVPNAVFRGEPFWGQDRIEALIWRLNQNGLTRRARPPIQ